MRHFPSLFIDTHKKHNYVTPADGRTTKTGVLSFPSFQQTHGYLKVQVISWIAFSICFESCLRGHLYWLGFNGVYQFLQAKDLQTVYDKWPHRLLWAGSRAARGQITVSGITNGLNYCVIFVVYIIYKSGRGQRNRSCRAAGRGPTLQASSWTLTASNPRRLSFCRLQSKQVRRSIVG